MPGILQDEGTRLTFCLSDWAAQLGQRLPIPLTGHATKHCKLWMQELRRKSTN